MLRPCTSSYATSRELSDTATPALRGVCRFRPLPPCPAAIRFESSLLALCSSARRAALSPRPARLIKYVSIRMPDCGPLSETFFDASTRAIVPASFLNNPAGGCVESVFTEATHLRRVRSAISILHNSNRTHLLPSAIPKMVYRLLIICSLCGRCVVFSDGLDYLLPALGRAQASVTFDICHNPG